MLINPIYGKSGGEPAKKYKKMTAIVDYNDFSVSYADDAVGMTAGSDEWDEFFGHYPCLFKNGLEVGKLKRNDFEQFEDGSPADITSGEAGDSMIAFPRRSLEMHTVNNKLYITFTDNPDESIYNFNAHRRGSELRDVFYLAVYEGWLSDGKLRSLKDKLPDTNQPITNFRNYAQANGQGYDIMAFYQVTYIQAMFILKYKSVNSQKAVGMGACDFSGKINTGGTEQLGMDWGDTASMFQHVKLFGVEDMWGNICEWADGLRVQDSVLLTSTDGFNTAGTGYENQGSLGSTQTGTLLIHTPQGTTEKGFIAKTLIPISQPNYNYGFCDMSGVGNNVVALYGGAYPDRENAGIFCWQIWGPENQGFPAIGARLMYL